MIDFEERAAEVLGSTDIAASKSMREQLIETALRQLAADVLIEAADEAMCHDDHQMLRTRAAEIRGKS